LGSPRESASLWAALLRRVFALDVFACPRCGGRRRLVGVHTGGEPLRARLERLGLRSASPSAEPSRPPPRATKGLPRPPPPSSGLLDASRGQRAGHADFLLAQCTSSYWSARLP